MTQFSPMLHRQFGTPLGANSGDTKPSKRGRSSLDDYEDCPIGEEESGFGSGHSPHVNFNAEKRSRSSSYFNAVAHPDVPVEDTTEYVNVTKRSRPDSIPQPFFSSHAGFSFNDSSTTVLRLEGELRHERRQIQVKEEQLHMACLENNSIRDQIQVVDIRSRKLNEENSILKRAVNIQEGRMKELQQQNQQLQLILAQAAQRIAQLESRQSSGAGGRNQLGDVESAFGRGPPDVF